MSNALEVYKANSGNTHDAGIEAAWTAGFDAGGGFGYGGGQSCPGRSTNAEGSGRGAARTRNACPPAVMDPYDQAVADMQEVEATEKFLAWVRLYFGSLARSTEYN